MVCGCVSVTYQQVSKPDGLTLAEHVTVARYLGVTEEGCCHLTAQCPDACEHGGVYAHFEIVKYLDYSCYSSEGEAQQSEFAVRLRLRSGAIAPETSPALVQMVEGLASGEEVALEWVHLYRITEKGNYPERIIMRLAE